MQGNLKGLKTAVNLLALSTCRKMFLFPFKLKEDLILFSYFLKSSFKYRDPLSSSWDTNETSYIITAMAIAYRCNDVRQVAC